MVVEIRFEGENVFVRGRHGNHGWHRVQPGEVDCSVTGYGYDGLRQLGPGMWDVAGSRLPGLEFEWTATHSGKKDKARLGEICGSNAPQVNSTKR